MMLSSSVTVSVKRVVTCFILSSSPPQKPSELTRETVRIAVFRRKDTMPTFASHWAGVSGSMEEGEEPWQTAVRELQEETNLVPDTAASSNNKGTETPSCTFVKQGGLYLDVPFKENSKIRVYPFVVHMKDTAVEKAAQTLRLLGTEHETFQFVSVPALEQLEPAVPGLATAFHHATAGAFLPSDALPEAVWKWAEDRENGAATLAKKAIDLTTTTPTSPSHLSTMAMLRPSMVPIVNVLRALEQKLRNGEAASTAAKDILKSLDEEADQSIQLGVDYLTTIYQEFRQTCLADQTTRPFTIATFSRSSTILKLLQRFVETSLSQEENDSTMLHIICAKSTPGDEGVLMAQDLSHMMDSDNNVKVSVECVEDETLHQNIRNTKVDVIVIGSDCVLDDQIVNKVGTKALAETCHNNQTRVLCCTDQWKFWDDEFPPPLEDIFECVPRSLVDHVAMHQPDQQSS